MKLSREFLDIASIRQDGGTQVRESLDRKWVEELAELYRDGHELPRPVVMRDANDVDWLVDGFHRIAALEKNGSQGVLVEILEGTLEMAKAQAARANTNGLPRTAGDKKRAILLMLSTPEGRKMSQRELAKHCGVTHGYVQQVVSSGVATTSHPPRTSNKRDEKRATVAAAVRNELLAGYNTSEVAKRLGVDDGVVRRERIALGLKTERDQAAEKAAAARSAWEVDASISVNEMKKRTGADHRVLAALRDSMGIVPLSTTDGPKRRDAAKVSAGTQPADQPSAQTRENDPRDTAVVEHKVPTLALVRPMPPCRSPRVVSLHQAYDQLQDYELEWAWEELSARHAERMGRVAQKHATSA